MDMRNWADLNTDCLINIFTRVGLRDTRSLIKSLQFVCKSWFRATCDPCCWETLTFSYHCCANAVNFAVQRSQGCVTTIICEYDVSDPAGVLPYIIEGCPLLKVLEIPKLNDFDGCAAPLLTSGLSTKWKNLEKFKLWACDFINLLVEAIGVHCKNLTELDFSFTEFEDEDIDAIVLFLPQLKSLTMTGSILYRYQLVAVLTACKDLEYLDVELCVGFVPDDEIYRLASHIKFFNCKGCSRTGYCKKLVDGRWLLSDIEDLPFNIHW